MRKIASFCTVLLFFPYIIIGFLLAACEAGINCGKEIYNETHK